MYSIVLMTAIASGPDAPQFNGYFRDMFNGGNGCGGSRYSCGGGGCSGTSTSSAQSCNGCCGGGGVFGLGLGDRVRRVFDRDPVGGCCGGGCCGGSSFANGCCGGVPVAYGCNGGCCGGVVYSYTPVFTGGLSCQGGLPMSAPPPVIYDSGPMIPGVPSAPGNPNIPFAVPDPAPGGVGFRPAAPATVAGSNAGRASVTVRVPADAKLFAEGKQLNLTGAERQFVSPPLPADQEFVYKFTAEYERNGETVSVSKKVTVRAGGTAAVEFADLTAAKPAPGPTAPASIPVSPASFDRTAKPTGAEPTKADPAPGAPERATITVKLPAGAALYVDDRKSPSGEPVRTFNTPALPPGREYAYVLKAELTRNGQPETLTQKVPFRAGERVVVDFTNLGK
jgi:uncharacterized protein (TIGR03000 family)